MKQYTTPTMTMTLEGQAALLAAAQSVIVTMQNGVESVDFEPTVSGEVLTWTLTQKQTADLVGKNKVEATIKATDGTVSKSDTVTAYISESVRQSEI